MDTQNINNPSAPPAAAQPEPAGFWIRLGAFIIDFICVWAPCMWFTSTFVEHLISKHRFGQCRGAGVSFSMLFASTFIYHFLTAGKWGQTLGKLLAGITIVDHTGRKISYARAFARTLTWYFVTLAMIVSLTVFLPTCGAGSPLTVLTLAFECLLGTILQNKIFFYDNLCGTRVIYKNPVGQLRKTAVVLFGITVLTAISYKTWNGHGWITEKARVAEAMSVFSRIKSEQELYFAAHGKYAGKFTELDLDYARMTAYRLPMKFYLITMSTINCGVQPCYKMTATRHSGSGEISSKYGAYSMSIAIPGSPEVRVAACPGGAADCAELLY